MERDWLEAQLSSGRSIESVAREVGRDPSTVAYWAHKHGLRSVHAPKHVARGPLPRAELLRLVDSGASVAEIAEAVDRSAATVRHWLRMYELVTLRASHGRARRAALDPDQEGVAVCPRHGLTRFAPRPGGGHRCLACRAEGVTRRRRRVKAMLVAEAGGACVLCGYDRTPAALHFHHRDPAAKRFHLAQGGIGRSIAAARAEVGKCVLLCANCHAEVEAGAATLSPVLDPRPG